MFSSQLGTNYPRGRSFATNYPVEVDYPEQTTPEVDCSSKPQHHRLVRPESHFPSIPAKRLIIVEYDLIILHILRQLVDCCVFTEVGANEKPLAPVCPAVGDDPSVFVVIFPCFSPQTLFVLLPEPQEFLVETGDKLPQRSIVQNIVGLREDHVRIVGQLPQKFLGRHGIRSHNAQFDTIGSDKLPQRSDHSGPFGAFRAVPTAQHAISAQRSVFCLPYESL